MLKCMYLTHIPLNIKLILNIKQSTFKQNVLNLLKLCRWTILGNIHIIHIINVFIKYDV